MTNSQILLERVLSGSNVTPAGCWIWQGPFQRSTPVLRQNGKVVTVRRALATEVRGRVRSLCGERDCVRPDHLGSDPPLFESHLQRWVGATRPPLAECWTFQLGDASAPASVTWKGRRRSARVVVFQQLVGRPPTGRLLATCGNSLCINPYHSAEEGDPDGPDCSDPAEIACCVTAILDGAFEGLAPPFSHAVIRAALEIVQEIGAEAA